MLVPLLVSCSGDYVDAIPKTCKAVMSVQADELFSSNVLLPQEGIIALGKQMGVSLSSQTGIDLSSPLYVFEAADGMMGLVMRVTDADCAKELLGKNARIFSCSPFTERKGYSFAVLAGSFVVGISSDALMVMGPAMASEQAQVQRRMAKYLKCDQNGSIRHSPLYEVLEQADAPLSLVAQVNAVPDRFAGFLIPNLPEDVPSDKVLLSASLHIEGNVLHVEGKTCSSDAAVQQLIQNSESIYRPIAGDYQRTLPDSALYGVFMNVDGARFLKVLRSNPLLKTWLAGANTAVDMDNIIRSINGDLAVIVPQHADAPSIVQIAARLGSREFLDDVGYWKQSCPPGTTISDWGHDAYICQTVSKDGQKDAFYFGVTPDNQFYGARNSQDMALQALSPARYPAAEVLRERIKGKRLCFVMSLSVLGQLLPGEVSSSLLSELYARLGETKTLIYTVE